ncbi:twin-arginine translocation pathway signal protein [Dankookia rubra]|uniref:Twin-arginine translocation pathway signal protein n=1 Tax=Dankookia rubra TaxID=1442381 RepID=A0A4R5QDM9_9PROT|nr:twin-arginine translocation pathway signal protein [Dankookia rubra]TDH60738.1 twin-arginine translocation pathway signal protein [Dankookia rubra]
MLAAPDNGDEDRYSNRIGADHRGLPHDARGEVDPAAWNALTKALASRSSADFEAIPLGGTRRLVGPLTTLASNLLGLQPRQFAAPPAPALASAARAAEAVEITWQALLRDVPFAEYRNDTRHSGLLTAVDELNRLHEFYGPRSGGQVTPESLFRGSVLYRDLADSSGKGGRWAVPPGTLDGPYVSQFFYRDIPFGAQSLAARIRTYAPTNEFLTNPTEWLHVQNGHAPRGRIAHDPLPRFVATGRDLGSYAHGAQGFRSAATQLLFTPASAGGLYPAAQPPLALNDPYRRLTRLAASSGAFSGPYAQSLVELGTSLGIRVAYHHKWWTARVLRPEAFAGLVQQRLANQAADYPIHEAYLGSRALERSRATHGSFLLGQLYPEGAPLHGSYPGGAAIAAAVTATLLKAFIDEAREWPDPVQPDPQDPTRLVTWKGPKLTLGGELNKFALNYASGRSWAGIHWRSDAAAAFALGEEVAIALLREQQESFAEPFEGFALTRFDGTQVTL